MQMAPNYQLFVEDKIVIAAQCVCGLVQKYYKIIRTTRIEVFMLHIDLITQNLIKGVRKAFQVIFTSLQGPTLQSYIWLIQISEKFQHYNHLKNMLLKNEILGFGYRD